VALGDGTGVIATTVGASDKVTVAVRPEKIALGAAAATCVNRYPAKVLEVSFLGDQLRVRLAALGREDFIV
jgi:putative spermidine/putrescine transport system ATP-binding protein